MHYLKKHILLCFLLVNFHAFSQTSVEFKKAIEKADRLYSIENYRAAFEAYNEALLMGDADGLLHFKMGMCLFRDPDMDRKLQSQLSFEKAIKSRDNETVPVEVYYNLAHIYHLNLQIEEAIATYEKYKTLIGKKSSDIQLANKADAQIKICRDARYHLKEKKNVQIKNLGAPVNTVLSEYNPVLAADESIMAYTVIQRNEDKITPGAGSIEKIFVLQKKTDGSWTEPSPIVVDTRLNMGTAGISSDGQKMLVFVGGLNNTGNLYFVEKTGKGWSNPVVMNSNVNSKYMENTASITPDGKTIFFSSNRPGGFGGMDIYRVERNSDGSWGYPQNLGSNINTALDEEAPFIHPDLKTMFFTSNGHDTMGGKDIFKSAYIDSEWSEPENLGYPVNSPSNEMYFTLTANGQKGFFSSDRAGGNGGFDIYTFDLQDEVYNIALTLLKGRIISGDSLKPLPAKMRVIDKERNTPLDYVYSPNSETGNYLIIFPPGKNYDIIVEAEGYIPHTINVYVPNQTRFYQLYQQIVLKPVRQFERWVGQEISVKNSFFNNHEQEFYAAKGQKVSSEEINAKVLSEMGELIMTRDKNQINKRLHTIYETGPVEKINFDETGVSKVETSSGRFFYEEAERKNLEAKIFGNDTVYTLSSIKIPEEKPKTEIAKTTAPADKKLLAQTYKVYFESGHSLMDTKYFQMMEEILKVLHKNNSLGIEISGFASSEGNSEYNKKLSNDRANEVLQYFNQNGLPRRRIISKAYGATQTSTNQQENRRVEIKIIDLES